MSHPNFSNNIEKFVEAKQRN